MPISSAVTAACGLVSGLKAQPVLLTIVLLNLFGIGAALWFLGLIVRHNAEHMETLLRACLPAAN
jgi:hypothetical protein